MNHRFIDTNSYGHWLWKGEDYTTTKTARYTEQKLEMLRADNNEIKERLAALEIRLKVKGMI